MKVKSEAEWQLFLAEIAASPDAVAEPFSEFVIAWAEAAEVMLDTQPSFALGNQSYSPIECLRHVLRDVEAKVGRWTVGFVGQALVVLGTHWEPAGPPDEFLAAMTVIEQNLYLDVLDVKFSQLQSAAAAMDD